MQERRTYVRRVGWWWRGEGRRTIRWFIVLGSQDGLRLAEKGERQRLRRVDRRGDPKEVVDLTSRSSTRLRFGSESSKRAKGEESSTLACLKSLTRAPPFDPLLLARSSPPHVLCNERGQGSTCSGRWLFGLRTAPVAGGSHGQLGIAVDESRSASASGKGQLEGVVEQESRRSKDVGV